MNEKQRISVKGTAIYLSAKGAVPNKTLSWQGVIKFKSAVPNIKVFEDDQLVKTYTIETLQNNPDLTGQYFHISISVQENDLVIIEGVLSHDEIKHLSKQDKAYEEVRLQPFYLKASDQKNKDLIGKGLFERGIHLVGKITPPSVRNVCICDYCTKSFSIQHMHAGFSELQYFYSDDCKQTLIVYEKQMKNLPGQIQEQVDPSVLKQVEDRLPKPNGKGTFRYYNPFRCPHCQQSFIDFASLPSIRAFEFYANAYINTKFYTLKDFQKVKT